MACVDVWLNDAAGSRKACVGLHCILGDNREGHATWKVYVTPILVKMADSRITATSY